jgi:hypothetical protein
MSELDTTVAKEMLPPLWLQGFSGINQHETRVAIDDEECFWMENFAPLGKGNARTMYDKAANTYTAASGISTIYFFPFNIGSTFYHAVFLSDGSAVAVNQATGSTTSMGAAATFATGPSLPYAVQVGSKGILFVTANVNGYFAWDGTLYSPGVTAPTWVTGGTVATMPTGLSGTALEVYQGHVWIINGATTTFSAPSNFALFATANGGGSFTSTDGFLRQNFVNIRQANGFLYILGDSSVNVISNVQTTGTTPTTTFNNQNADPQNGLGWRDALVAFGRSLVYANQTGVYALFGGAAEKISHKIDSLFANADFTNPSPSMYVDDVFGVRMLGLILNTLDPTTGTQRTLVCLWNGEKWFVGSQSVTLKFANTSGFTQNPSGWATDGTGVFQVFHLKSSTLSKKIVSKLWEGRSNLVFKRANRVYAETKDNGNSGATITGSVDSDVNAAVSFSLTSLVKWLNNSGGVVTWLNNLSQTVTWLSNPSGITGQDVNASGRRLGVTLQTTSPDITLVGAGLMYEEMGPYA